jgi:hypothetical protein
MGCDIHWILERRHQDGAWEATYSKSRFYDRDHDWKTPYGEGSWQSPAMALSTRDYDLFAALSGVRGDPGRTGEIATGGLPEGASDYALMAFGENGDLHSLGWIEGATVVRLAKARSPKSVSTWAKQVLRLLDTPEAGREILPPYTLVDPDEGWAFADLAGAESQHQKLERHRRADGLMPTDDPANWRILIAYDN